MTTLLDRADLGPDGVRARPTAPPGPCLEDVTVRLAVDPVHRTWVHLHLHGDDDSALKTLLLVDGEQASWRDTGDPEPIDVGTRAPVPGGLLVSTALLPLTHTQGRESVEITLRTYRHSYRTAADVTGAELADEPSRRYLAVETHTAAVPDPLPVPAGPDPVPAPAAPDPGPVRRALRRDAETLRREQEDLRRAIGRRAADGRLPDIQRYREELRFLLETARGPLAAAGPGPRECVDILRRTLDEHVRAWVEDVTLVGTGGHQGDWGGYHAPLGEALHLAEPLLRDPAVLGAEAFHALLEEPFPLRQGDGPDALPLAVTLGTCPTRREAWELLLKATLDLARARSSSSFNQVLYTIEGAWRAHEGLRVIGSRHYEGPERSRGFLREAWGLAPFLGEEVLLGHDDRELDLFHSLFRHDGNAEFTEDVRREVMTGRARTVRDPAGRPARRRPYGDQHRGLTAAGLPRENSYVGVYGEAVNHLPGWVERLSHRLEDAPLRDELVRAGLRNLQVRARMRYPDRERDGTPVMRMEQVIDDRNPALPGRTAYLTETGTGATSAWVGLARRVLDPEGAFRGPEHAPERELARDVMARALEEAEAGHALDAFSQVSTHPAAQRPYLLRQDPALLENVRGLLAWTEGGAPLPHGPHAPIDPEDLTDPEAMVLAHRSGDEHLWVNLSCRSAGFSGTGRFHLVRDRLHVIGTLAVHGLFTAHTVAVRGVTGEPWRQHGEDRVMEGRRSAWTGHLQPVTHQSGVGETRRENLAEDTPYAALPDLAWTRCGDHLIAVNTTSREHGNDRRLALPSGVGAAAVLAPGEMRRIPAGPASAPEPVRAVVRTDAPGATGVAWSAAGGAACYDVLAADGERVLAPRVHGTAVVLSRPEPGPVRIRAWGGDGSAAPAGSSLSSMTSAERPVTLPPSAPEGTGVLIGAARGTVHRGADGTDLHDLRDGALATGDDSRLDWRHRPDALGMLPAVSVGRVDVLAELPAAPERGALGIAARASLAPAAPMIALLVDAEGGLLVQLRDAGTREDLGVGNPGDDAAGGIVRSPRLLRPAVPGDGPVRALHLVRETARSPFRLRARTADGTWHGLGEHDVAMPEALLVGSVATGTGSCRVRTGPADRP